MQVTEEEVIYNQILPGTEQIGYSPIYRQKGLDKLISTPSPQTQTIRDILWQCKNKYGHKRGLGQIIVTVEKGPNGEDIQKRTMKQYTYGQIYQTAYNLGKALANRGLAFKEETQGINILGIHSKNRRQWFIVDWASSLFGYVLAPLYDTLGKQNLAHCIDLTGITTLFVQKKTAEQFLKFKLKGSIKTLVSFDRLSEALQEQLKQAGIQLLYYSDLLLEGSKLQISNEDIKVDSNDVYSFCFTSGTTGPPKAGILKHGSMVAAIVPFVLHKDLGFNSQDVHLSYLPLPHLMERFVANTLFNVGAFVVISSGNILKLRDDAAAAQITIFISVPRLFNRLVDNVKTTLRQMVTDQTKRPVIQKAVYEKVKQSFGGKVRIMATGSAPINPEIQKTLQEIFGCALIQGYGQTESSGAVLFSRKTNSRYAELHQISAAVELRLADIPEMKYTSKDTDSQGRPTPRGEICVRGPQIFGGYYKMQEITKETLDADGWLRTGDVGEISPELTFKIIDRKKNIFKLQQGQYVAPDRVEACYLNSGFIDEIFLHGASNQSFAVAIVSPKKEKVTQIAAKFGIQGSFEDLCLSNRVRYGLLEDLNAFAKKNGLYGYQVAKNVYFQTLGFAARKILTNTQKLIRFQARTTYKDQIEAMYAQGQLKI